MKTLRDSVFENMLDSISVTNTQCSFLLCNENFNNLTGYSKNDIVDDSRIRLQSLFSDQSYSDRIINQVTQGLVLKNQKTPILTKEGKLVPVSFSVTYMANVNKLTFVFTDLQTSEAMMRQINELKKYARSAMVISAFKVGEHGPEVLSFEQSDLFNEETLMKMAIFFSVSLGQGDLIHKGIYGPLPIPMASSEKYVSLIYSFIISDKGNKDVRARERSYSLITINLPEKIIDVFNKRKILNSLFEQALLDFNIKEITEITEEFLLVIKERVLNMEIDSTSVEFDN